MRAIDMHCDTISEIYTRRKRGEDTVLRQNSLMVDLSKLEQGGYSVQNFALFVEKGDEKKELSFLENQEEESMFARVKELLHLFKEEMKHNADRISQVYRTEDILQNEIMGKISALLTVEEGGVCEGDLEKLYHLYREGVRMMTLTWNFPNEIGYPNFNEEKDLFTPDRERGLTETGLTFVEEMDRISMIIDVSHLSDAGFYDVLTHTKNPFVASHSNARTVCPVVRNLTDDMLKQLGERGGVAGLNYCMDFLSMPFKKNTCYPVLRPEGVPLDMVAKHARHMADKGGIECVGLGSDFDGIPVNAEISSADKLPYLADALSRCGFNEREMDQIFYQNVFRVYKDVLG